MAVTKVHGYETAGEYVVNLKYTTDFDSILALASVSAHCYQHVRWECKASTIWSVTTPGLALLFWENRDSERRYYWGDAAPGSDMCACGMNGACAKKDARCNCDSNDQVIWVDEGYLTNMDDIPMTSFRAGDTGKLPFLLC